MTEITREEAIESIARDIKRRNPNVPDGMIAARAIHCFCVAMKAAELQVQLVRLCTTEKEYFAALMNKKPMKKSKGKRKGCK